MLFKYAEKLLPHVISPESLDHYLGRGWYRMGANLFTTHFLFFQNQPFSAVWIRLDLEGFAFSRSQRKLMRRNEKLFRSACQPIVIDRERELLFQRYAAEFDGILSPSITDSLEHYEGQTAFNTWETTVRERTSGKLVALSYFDLGAATVASINGFYDPPLRSFSLGYYTMLLEIEYCLAHGYRYYYPGYVVPGYHRFDYKLRIGDCEYLDVRDLNWKPFAAADIRANGPVEGQRTHLEALSQRLVADTGAGQLKIYPLFEASLYDIWNDEYFPYPYCIVLSDPEEGDLLVAAYDPGEQEYLILLCSFMLQTQLLFNATYLEAFPPDRFHTKLMAVRHIAVRTKDPEVIYQACRTVLSSRSTHSSD